MGFAEEARDQKRRQEQHKHDIELQNRLFRHNWKVMFVSAFLGAFLSKPLWTAIEWIILLITQ